MLLAGLAPRAIACEFCNCLLAINPYYSSTDRLVLSYLYQQSTHMPQATGTAPVGGGGILKRGPNTMAQQAGIITLPGLYHQDHGSTPVTETLNTFELAAEHHFNEHLMLTGIVPFAMIAVSGAEPYRVHGIGDPMLMGHYVIASDGEGIRTTLLGGAGIDIPIGANNLRAPDGDRLDAASQPGDGIVDVLLNARGSVQTGSWIFAADAFGRIPTASNQYGDRRGSSADITATANLELFRANASSTAVTGFVGLRAELADADRVDGTVDATTRHTTGFANLGGQFVYNNVRLSASASIPVFERRGGTVGTDGIQEQARLVASVAYEF